MNFKLCFAQQINRCSKAPDSYESLRTIVKQTFKDISTKNFVLSYLDQDGDRIHLVSEEDFKLMMDYFLQSNRAVKVFVTEEEKDEIPDQFRIAAHRDSTEEKIKEISFEEKKLEEPKQDSYEQIKPENAAEHDRLDLSDKKALKAFIIQTIEESLPQILSNCLKQRVIAEKKNFEEFNIVKGLKSAAIEITSKIEKFVIGEREGLFAKISKTEKVVPEVVTTTDEQIAVSVLLKNYGTLTFPQNAFLQNVDGIYGDLVQIPSLESRKNFKTTLLLKSPKEPGNYTSKWRFGYIDENGMNVHFGDEYEFKVTIIEKKYSKEVQEKAGQLKELIPQVDINNFLEFTSKRAKHPIEALIEEYLAENPSI